MVVRPYTVVPGCWLLLCMLILAPLSRAMEPEHGRQLALRTGQQLEFELDDDEPERTPETVIWSTSGGSLEKLGNRAILTAPNEPGFVIVRADVIEDQFSTETHYFPVLVYKQFVLLKADDYVGWTGDISAEWRYYVEYLTNQRRLKHSVGIITMSMDGFTPPGAYVFTEDVKAMDDSGLVEFWHHGLTHDGMPDGDPPMTEFFGQTFSFQRTHLDDGRTLARETANVRMTTFGAPFGLTDATTLMAMESLDPFDVWYSGQAGFSGTVLDVNGNAIEQTTGLPSFSLFEGLYDPDAPYVVLQVHPGFLDQTNTPTFIENFDEFEQAIDFLLAEEATFILPHEYHLLEGGMGFPLHPDDDTDGDGVNDFAEGQEDADEDGLPDFLDPTIDGSRAPGIQSLEVTEGEAGVFIVQYDLDTSTAADVQAAVSLDGGLTFPLIPAGVTGDIGTSVAPGAGKSFTWDTTTDINKTAASQYVLRVSANDAVSTTIPLQSIEEGGFQQGCPDCNGGNALPVHTVQLSTFEIAQYETTNADFVSTLNYALDEGYLEDVTGDPYVGGDVFLDSQRLYRLTDPEAEITFDGNAFSVAMRDGEPLDNHPVVHVSWYGAAAYCNWVSEQEGLTPAYDLGGNWPRHEPVTNGYRLPTESEWERAAAWQPPPGATHFRYGFSQDVINPAYANYDNLNPGAYTAGLLTTPVGFFNGAGATLDATSPAGAYDMSGNAAEWCHDRVRDYPDPGSIVRNPSGGDTRGMRVVRGGAWSDAAEACRTDTRETALANTTTNRIGFRIARGAAAGSMQARITLDNTPPQVTAFALEEAPLPTAQTVTLSVSFSEAVAGVDAADFSPTASGIVDMPPKVIGVSGGPIVWEVQVDTGSMEGTLGLALTDDATIVDNRNNPLTALAVSGPLHTVTTLAPIIQSLELLGAPALNARTLTFLATFSKPVEQVGIDDFAATSAGDVVSSPAVTGVFGTGNERQVTVSVNQVEGMVGLRLMDTNQIKDFSGRAVQNTLDTGLVHTADTVGQRIQSIELLGSPALTDTTVTFRITFTDAVTGFAPQHIQVGFDGLAEGAPGVDALRGSGDTYEVDVNVGMLQGVLRITVLDISGEIVDSLGNTFVPTGTISPPHTADTLHPDVASITVDGSPPLNAPEIVFTITFTEAVSGVSENNIFLSSNGTGSLPPAITEVREGASPAEWKVTVAAGTFEGLLSLTVPDGVLEIVDGVGNTLDRGLSTGLARAVDTIAPILENIVLTTNTPTAAEAVTWELVFSEAMESFAGTGATYIEVDASGLNYTGVSVEQVTPARYRVTVADLTGDGTVTVTLGPDARGGIPPLRDTAGNTLAPVTIDPIGARVDRLAPIPRCQDVTLNLGLDRTAILQPNQIDDGSEDGLEIQSLTLSRDTFTCTDLDTPVTVTLNVTDTVGNMASCEAVVTVTDTNAVCTGDGAPEIHSADWNGDPDGRIDLTELLRAVQLYQFGEAGYCCDLNKGERVEDGYVSGPCEALTCPPHALDYDPRDRQIDMHELLRLIQFYNAGGYYRCDEGAEDGYCAGEPEGEGDGAQV